MKFSTKSRYALRLMAELARYAPGTTVSLKEISERQNLSRNIWSRSSPRWRGWGWSRASGAVRAATA